MSIMSCDTMVALGNSTKNGHVIFAKNSDRPVTEAQPLVIFEAADHKDGETVDCTYITIPQVKHTYRVLGSKPFWLWGFEHGMNECGVAIGNEAVWAKEAEESENGLLGMDLLRLALERGSTAYEAMHIIIDLLEKYGQGGNCAQGMEHRYHNAFLLADAREAWVLDTCNRRWIAQKVKDVQAISNCYSIEEDWDEASPDIMEHAYAEGWISEDVKFNFAKAYSAMHLKHRAAYARFVRGNELLRENIGAITIETVRDIQRDHYEGTLIAPRWSPADALEVSICMHAINETASKTAASAQTELIPGKESIWWNAFACPCVSIYAPYRIGAKLPEEISSAGAQYSGDSAWWQFERLQYAIEEDYPARIGEWRSVVKAIEEEFRSSFVSAEDLTDSAIVKNTTQILDAVDREYRKIVSEGLSSNNPQRIDVNRIFKRRAGIE